MHKGTYGAVVLAAVTLAAQAHAYSFEATFSLTNTQCTSSEAWDGCSGIGPGQAGSLVLTVGDYAPGRVDSTYSVPFTFTDSYTGIRWGSENGGGGLFSFYSYPTGYNFGVLELVHSGRPDALNAPLSMLPNTRYGSFSAAFGHSQWWGSLTTDVTLISFRDTSPVSPVPEPEAAWMLGAGAGLLGWMLRRRRSILQRRP